MEIAIVLSLGIAVVLYMLYIIVTENEFNEKASNEFNEKINEIITSDQEDLSVRLNVEDHRRKKIIEGLHDISLKSVFKDGYYNIADYNDEVDSAEVLTLSYIQNELEFRGLSYEL